MNKKKLIFISTAILLFIIATIISMHILHHWNCYSSGGKWHTFSNGCADSCNNYSNKAPITCTTAITKSCKCTADECWNGNTCVDIE